MMHDEPSLDSLIAAAEKPAPLLENLVRAVQSHPLPLLGIIETVVWGGVLLTIFDHLLAPEGTISFVVWLLTIVPHEMGHIICNPFGTLVMFLGGTIWQVLLWLLIGAWGFFFRRQLTIPLLCWALVGHSFINASRYIADASLRQMPLLFGLSADHHDWWNILSMLGLLEYDGLLAGIARIGGALMIVAVSLIGVYCTWVYPRLRLYWTSAQARMNAGEMVRSGWR
jgi:hypothetical protein